MEKNHITRKLSVRDFFKRFPDDAACLERLMDIRFGLRHTCQKCGVVDATFHRLENRKAYCCAHCGGHVYPCAGTIFEKAARLSKTGSMRSTFSPRRATALAAWSFIVL